MLAITFSENFRKKKTLGFSSQRRASVSNAWHLIDIHIKQYAVTNCSKERPGSIVTRTLKNGILVPIATSKELHFNAYFKYISFIKFGLKHQKLRA